MKRLWWGLLGVAILATTSGCRHTCGESNKCRLFSRESGSVPTQLTSGSRDCTTCSLPTTGYPLSSGPIYPSGGSLPSGAIPGPSLGSPTDTIPPPFVPATPMAVPPAGAAKNILPPPLALAPTTSAVGMPK